MHRNTDNTYKTYSKLISSNNSNAIQTKNVINVSNVSMCQRITNIEDKNNCLMENRIVCVDLYADWCGPCKLIAPEYDKLAQKYNKKGICKLVKENVEDSLTQDFQINGIPAFIFYKDGRLVVDGKREPVSVVGGNLQQVESILNTLLQQ